MEDNKTMLEANNIDVFISVFDGSIQNNFSFTPSLSVSLSEPNSTTAEDFTAVDIIGFDDEFHLTYLDYNNKILYYRKLTPQNNIHLENFKLNKYKLKTIDILGRNQFKTGLSIDIYNDGSTEKKYRVLNVDYKKDKLHSIPLGIANEYSSKKNITSTKTLKSTF